MKDNNQEITNKESEILNIIKSFNVNDELYYFDAKHDFHKIEIREIDNTNKLIKCVEKLYSGNEKSIDIEFENILNLYKCDIHNEIKSLEYEE